MWQSSYRYKIVLVLWTALEICLNPDFALGHQNPACTSYAELDTANRHVSWSGGPLLCDSSITIQWYRFIGSAGTSMPESCPAPGYCSTTAPGWLNGIHPTVAEGEVTRAVCFSYNGNCCYLSNTIKVLNCGDFYVYELKPPPSCNLRYCGTNVAPRTQPPPECLSQGYTVLNEANRYWNYDDGSMNCDQSTVVSNQWYRFEGAAGVMMASHCIPIYSCNSKGPGWINGAHPTGNYEMAFRDACMHWRSCCDLSYPTVIRNCSGFYVYKLQRPGGCYYRYCGVNDVNDACVATPHSSSCGCQTGYTGSSCIDIDECETATHNCHGVADCYNNEGSFSCSCREGYTGDGLSTCQPSGDFIVTIRDISKDCYNATVVKRSSKRIQEAVIEGLPEGATVLDSVLEWRLLSEEEWAASESAEGTLVSQGTTEWVIKRKSIQAGKYQVKFTASYTISDPVGPRTLQAFNYGFIKVILGSLRAVIDGGSVVHWGSNATVTVDGSLSYDKDIGPGSHAGLNFTWSCLVPEEKDSMSFDCFGAFIQEGTSNVSVITIDTSLLEVGKTYTLQLTLLKDIRSSSTEMSFEIATGKMAELSLRCLVDCLAIVSSSNKFRVTSECPNSRCVGASYKWILEKFHIDTKNWEIVPNLAEMTATPINATNIIIKQNMLISNSQYRIKLNVTSEMKPKGYALLEFETAGEPYGGYCQSSVGEGVSLETAFTFECRNWKDTSTPLTYEFRLGDEPVSYGLSPMSVSTVLPSGLPVNNYTKTVNVLIRNVAGVTVIYSFTIKVTPSSALDICQSSLEQVTGELENLVLGPYNELDGYLRKSEISQAAQLALSVLSSFGETTECGQSLPTDIQFQVMCASVVRFAAITPSSRQMGRLIGSVIAAATNNSELTCDGFNAFELTLNLTNDITVLLASAIADVEEPFSPEIEEAATAAIEMIGNVLKSAGAGNVSEVKANSKNALAQINTITESISSRLVTSESLVIKKPDLSISLKKVASDDINGLNLEEELTQFSLPSNLNLHATGDISAKMMRFDSNPFTWDPSSESITSSICSLELTSGGNGTLNVSGLDKDIEMTIPIKPNGEQSSDDEPGNSFLTPNKMTIHRYYAELANSPVSLYLAGQNKDVVVEVLIKFGSKPTLDEFDQNVTVVLTACHTNLTGDNATQNECASQLPISVSVIPPEPSVIYIGIMTFGENNITEHSRKKRSCFGRGRQKRSCVGVKDPPPQGFNKTVIPKYDPLTNVNYTMTMSQSSCLYWSTTMEKWTSEGCKVGPSTDKRYLKCLCNHLTAFGGSFIQAPNPIDFDKVFMEFTRLGETGNIAVLVTIAVLFLCYFVLIVIVRRADKRDENKITPPKTITVSEGGSYVYEMVVNTGVWRNSGSTANIAILIVGERNESSEIILRRKGEKCETFSRGSIDGFELITSETYGPLKEITVLHDNSGKYPSWFLETVTIRDRQTGEQWDFPANRWLAVEKEDGKIEVTIPCLSRSFFGFSDQVRSLAPRRLADSHIWMSVFGKASSSTFTRVQRASCCMSILFSAMIANAMFYNIGGESEAAIQVGPFKFSWRQIVIGVQSGIIVAPVNVLIVLLFRSSRAKQQIGDSYKSATDSLHLVEDTRKSSCMLPHFCIYIGWFFCIATTLASAAFTLFYSLMWGKELAEQWLASIFTSLAEDIFFMQPTKVILVVCVVSLFLHRKNGGRKASENDNETSGCNVSDSEFIDDDPKKTLRRYELEKMRENKKKEGKLIRMMREIVLHSLFVFLMAITCYGNKNNNRFLMTNAVKQPFLKFETVTHPHRLWGWMGQFFIPNIYAGVWYNAEREEDEIFFGNKRSILLGMPRMKQVRVKNSSCGMLSALIPHCYYDYTFDNEDKTLMSLPGWKELPINTTWPDSLKMCPRPWRYQSPEDLGNALPTQGKYKLYNGGGYIAAMGYDEKTADGVINEMHSQGWIDQQTRVVVIEFTVFNVNTNLISIASFFYEVLATGAAYTSKKIDTLELYSTESGAQEFYLICQFLFMAMTLFYFVLLVINLFRQRTVFFKSVWNLVEFLQIISSVTSVTFYMLKAKSILRSINAIQANPYAIVNFDSSLSWAEWENVSIAIAIFMATLKFLNLLRFNSHVIFLFSTFRQSIGSQLSFFAIFLLTFNSFSMSGIQMFGGSIYLYSSYLRATVAQFEFLLGKAVPLEDLRAENPIIGPIFALLYMLTLTLLLMNMLVSMLNESYSGAKANIEDSADDLELAHYLEERLSEFFGSGRRRRRDLTKLFCDEATFVNMCSSEAEPYCTNTERSLQCTDERLIKVNQRIAKLTRLTQAEEVDHFEEDTELLIFISNVFDTTNP